jgi:hypothetical protein
MGSSREHMISVLILQRGESKYITFNVSKLAYSLIPDRSFDKEIIFAIQGEICDHSCDVE